MNNKGFSLVELIIVIAIMAVLVGIVGTQVIPYMENSRQAKDVQVLSSYATAGVMAYASHPDYAPDSDMSIEITSNGSEDIYVCDDANAQIIADELKNLIGKNVLTEANQSFQSKKYRPITKITVAYDFTNRQIKIYASDGTNVLNMDTDIFGIL